MLTRLVDGEFRASRLRTQGRDISRPLPLIIGVRVNEFEVITRPTAPSTFKAINGFEALSRFVVNLAFALVHAIHAREEFTEGTMAS